MCASPKVYAIVLATTLAACFGLQQLALAALGGRTAKSESNYFSSLARIQAGARGVPQIMMLGSSITGRLPDRSQGYTGFSNMGCDGGTAVDALLAMDKGILPQSPWIVIEANSMLKAMTTPRNEISRAMDGWWFRVGLRCSALSATARPSAFAYSVLMGSRVGAAEKPDAGGTLRHRTLPGVVQQRPSEKLGDPDQMFVDGLAEVIDRLERNGSRFVIIWLPPKRGEGEGTMRGLTLALALAHQSGSLWWDLAGDSEETVTLTDGVHMDASSAAKTTRSLAEGLHL